MGGSPGEKPEVYRRANVLRSVDDVRTPLLVMQNDPQVPPTESAAFVKALRAHHKTVFNFTYPGELQRFAQPAQRLDAWEKKLASSITISIRGLEPRTRRCRRWCLPVQVTQTEPRHILDRKTGRKQRGRTYSGRSRIRQPSRGGFLTMESAGGHADGWQLWFGVLNAGVDSREEVFCRT